MKLKLYSILALFLTAFTWSGVAKADLTITPTKIIFEDRDRFKEVTLINPGDETRTYEIGWQFYRMLENGSSVMEQVEGSLTEFDLSQHMVFTPRRMTLAPGGKQKIRLALRRPPEVPAGEYRAHLLFRALRAEDAPDAPTDQASFKAGVKINISYSIPVVFRAGTPNVTGKIENVAFQRNPKNNMLEALVTVSRQGGPYGVIGHMYIYDPTGKVIGEIGNAHIFPEVPRRVFRVPLIDESNLSGGNIRVMLAHYTKNENFIYDERSIPVR